MLVSCDGDMYLCYGGVMCLSCDVICTCVMVVSCACHVMMIWTCVMVVSCACHVMMIWTCYGGVM